MVRNVARLSKSKFQKGLQCEKALWLQVREPESADPISESTQWIFDQGTEVGRLAQGLFPGGTEVWDDHRHSDDALATTARLLSEGVTTLYEPAFLFDGVLVRIDILVAAEDGQWDLFEVKSTSSLKREHVSDVAVQTYAIEGSGLSVRRSNLVHLNAAYAYEGYGYDVDRMFTVEDVTDEVRSFMPSVHDRLERFRFILEGPEPDLKIGTQCHDPYECAFSGRCHAFLPSAHPITDIPRLSEKSLHTLLDTGITCVLDVPEDFPLSGNQAETVAVVKSGKPWVDVGGLRRELSKLEWPVYHLDFETAAPALPLWVGTHPHEAVPFLYSLHIEKEDGSFTQGECLSAGTDPRRDVAEALLLDLGTVGSVTHYTSYEKRILDGLATAFPDLAAAIAAIEVRMVDLEPIVKANTKHPDACGRTSIKFVLPAWCPDMSYSEFEIHDGLTASVRYQKAVRRLVNEADALRTFADLCDYCEMDTLAMVRLLDALRAEI